MFTLIFDTYSGLCNQMYDIQAAVNYCLAYNIQFSFRFASLRTRHDLCRWFDIPFDKLFDDSMFTRFSLYKPYHTLDCNPTNTHHYNNQIRAIEWLDPNRALLPQFEHTGKKYIVLRQFWSIPCNIKEQCNTFALITPCKKIRSIFRALRREILPEQYNFIHYRYEDDFNAHFNIATPLRLCDIINHVQFNQSILPTYIAANNVNKLPISLLSKPLDTMDSVLYKSSVETTDLNFEEAAFVDFMIGKNAQQVYGHHNSSFSALLNMGHATNNYYDLEMK